MERTGRVGRGQALHPRAGPGAAGLGLGLRGARGQAEGRPGSRAPSSQGGMRPQGGAVLGVLCCPPDRVSLPTDLRRQKKQLRPPRGQKAGSGSARWRGQGKHVPGWGPSHPGVCEEGPEGGGSGRCRRARDPAFSGPRTPSKPREGHELPHHGRCLLDSNHPVSQRGIWGAAGAEVFVSRSCRHLSACSGQGWFQTQPTCPGPATSIHRRHFIDVLGTVDQD